MEKKEQLPPWRAIIPASIIILAVFYAAFQILMMLFFDVFCPVLFKMNLPHWCDTVAVGIFGVAMFFLIMSSKKGYEYLEKKFTDNIRQQEQAEEEDFEEYKYTEEYFDEQE